jgi:hypothetical protein
VPERMAVRLLDRGARRSAHLVQEHRSLEVGGELTQVRVAPGRGDAAAPYRPTPTPTVVSTPSRECRLWSISPCWVLNSNSSMSSGCP